MALRSLKHHVRECMASTVEPAMIVVVGLLLCFSAGCNRNDPNGGSGGETEETLLLDVPEVRRNPNDDAPLAALVDFSTREPVSATLAIDDGLRRWTYSPRSNPVKEHRLTLLGLRPGREHQIRLQLETADGKTEISEPFLVQTPPLPDDFPPIEALVSRPEKMEPGVTLFPVARWMDDKDEPGYGYYVAIDEQGEVVWYFRTGHRPGAFYLTQNGHLLHNRANFMQVVEVDLLGNLVQQWHATKIHPRPQGESGIDVDLDTMHHESIMLPSGNILVLSTELRRVDEFPTSGSDPTSPPGPATLVGDEIVEFTREGEIVGRWPLLDVLDPNRIGYGSLGTFWNRNGTYPDEESCDWSHANAIYCDHPSDSMIVSVRHQDCLVKIDRASGGISWILGNHNGWGEPWKKYLLQPVGELAWPFHQHGPELTPAGTILLYDNGNNRAAPFDAKTPAAENYSRVVEYEVNEDDMTVSQVWQYRGGESESFYSPFYGEADLLPQTGNVLIADGGRIELADGTQADPVPSERQWARILEVTHTEPAEKVFEVVIDSGLDSPQGWSVYRSQRIADLQSLIE